MDTKTRLIEELRNLVRTNGFMSASQIFVRANKTMETLGITEDNWNNKLRKVMTCKDIRRLQYTNRFIEKYKNRDLFYYKPQRSKK